MHPLRRARVAKNLTQQTLADLCALGIATIERAERGQSVCADTRQRLCTFFDCPPFELGLLPERDCGEGKRTMLHVIHQEIRHTGIQQKVMDT